MPSVIVVIRERGEHAVVAETGLSPMEAIRDAGGDELPALCGGGCSCATCHGYVDPAVADRLPPIGEDESDLLDSSAHRDAISRLSGQVPIDDAREGLRATIAPDD